MEINKTNELTHAGSKHLPHLAPLEEYDLSPWICFGGLTHRHQTSVKSQLAHFRTLMDAIGSLNDSFGRRLHWVARAEKDSLGETHLHFLLAGHKVVDGKKHQFTPSQACAFLEKNWAYGICDVQVYDSTKNGLGYVFKSDGNDRDDLVEISASLMTDLKRRKADPRYARDPFTWQLIHDARARGFKSYWGDEIPEECLVRR